ncbi:MAG: T9SS type A sorting domain-containing protein [Elusimicrobia bacterium]|nr:T9SS type A sorting domain-containing protein [Elusimicrobiota bacterium]
MSNIVSAFCLTALLASPAAAAFTLNKVAPRIFTPAEGSVDVNRVRFYFSNPDGGEVTIRIFDITGALVRRNLDTDTSGMYWNGKDQSGAQVKAGVYIYQVEAGEEVLTGTVVVAK